MKDKKRKKKCKSRYPKAFSNITMSSDSSYPLYRRRDDGVEVNVRKSVLNNKWFIPRNPYLLAMFDCHINVEVCSTISVVKYLYKYVYKGHDRISFIVACENASGRVNEIENYQSGRWVSPPEAAWRIFGFNLYNIYPPVSPLPVHIVNSQQISLLPTRI